MFWKKKLLLYFFIPYLIFLDIGYGSSLNILPNLKRDFPSLEVLSQKRKYPGSIEFDQAVQIALDLVLNSTEEAETPFFLYQEEYFGQPKELIQTKLKEDLQNGKSIIRLVGKYDPVERNEDISKNWIFFLKIPTFSDHLYWIVIDRMGKTCPYLYGFN